MWLPLLKTSVNQRLQVVHLFHKDPFWYKARCCCWDRSDRARAPAPAPFCRFQHWALGYIWFRPSSFGLSKFGNPASPAQPQYQLFWHRHLSFFIQTHRAGTFLDWPNSTVAVEPSKQLDPWSMPIYSSQAPKNSFINKRKIWTMKARIDGPALRNRVRTL